VICDVNGTGWIRWSTPIFVLTFLFPCIWFFWDFLLVFFVSVCSKTSNNWQYYVAQMCSFVISHFYPSIWISYSTDKPNTIILRRVSNLNCCPPIITYHEYSTPLNSLTGINPDHFVRILLYLIHSGFPFKAECCSTQLLPPPPIPFWVLC